MFYIASGLLIALVAADLAAKPWRRRP